MCGCDWCGGKTPHPTAGCCPSCDAAIDRRGPVTAPSVEPGGLREQIAKAVLDNFHGPDERHSTWWLNPYVTADAILDLLAVSAEPSTAVDPLVCPTCGNEDEPGQYPCTHSIHSSAPSAPTPALTHIDDPQMDERHQPVAARCASCGQRVAAAPARQDGERTAAARHHDKHGGYLIGSEHTSPPKPPPSGPPAGVATTGAGDRS